MFACTKYVSDTKAFIALFIDTCSIFVLNIFFSILMRGSG